MRIRRQLEGVNEKWVEIIREVDRVKKPMKRPSKHRQPNKFGIRIGEGRKWPNANDWVDVREWPQEVGGGIR